MQWHSKMSSFLIKVGFTQSRSGHSLFVKGHNSNFIFLLAYVDDIVVAGPNQGIINSLKSIINSEFQLKDLGFLRYFFGLEVGRINEGIILSQGNTH